VWYVIGVVTLRALVRAGDQDSGDARSWYMISGDANCSGLVGGMVVFSKARRCIYLSCDWDNVTRMPTSTGEEIILDFEHLAVRLASTKRDLERVLLKPRHFRDDRYGCESSGAGDEPCAIAHDGFLLATPNTTSFKPASSTDIGALASTPSKRAHQNVFQRELSQPEWSP
ncbi:hypothetical protein Tco_0942945, partial [Tanacetum coccineum]